MKLFRCAFLLLLVLTASLTAALTVDDVVARVKASYAEADTLTCDLRRVTVSGLLGQRRVLLGGLRMDLPDRFRIEYHTPYEQILVCDGETYWLYTVKNGQCLYGPVADFAEQTMLTDLVGYFERDYAYELDGEEEVNGVATVRLRMTARDPAEAYPAGRLWIDTDRWLPLQIELVDEQGNELSYRLSDIELDAALDDGLFTFEAPAGVELLRMER